MNTNTLKFLGLIALTVFNSCESDDVAGSGGDNKSIKELRFIDEYIIPDNTMFKNSVVGGLSGIDYANGNWYLISDDVNSPRFYTANIKYDIKGFNELIIEEVSELKDKSGNSFSPNEVDPESIRFTNTSEIIWSSEGHINKGIDPFVRFAGLDGTYKSEAIIDEKFKASVDASKGPRQNGVFEGLSLAKKGKGYWVSVEIPLIQDGPEPTIEDTNSPVRIVFVDENGAFKKEFAYELDAVARRASETSFTINGVVEILEYADNKFLVLERSFSTGYSDGGNNVKIYDVDVSKATDVSGLDSLKDSSYTKATKKLLFDFESIRSKLTNGIVDNIEGIAFGPRLDNGNRSLVLVADNNFSAFEPQLNQFILMEVK